jgi:predicted AlkP superfamily phosphohydrolase/phosphomutase
MVKRKKLYVIGLDGVSLWIISRLAKRQRMKGFEYLINEGRLMEMASTIPPVSAAAWPSIYSGKKPGEHGVMDFIHIDKNYTRQLIYYDMEKHQPFWEELAKKGFRSLAITPAMVLQKSRSKNVDMMTGWPLQPSFNSKQLEGAAKRFRFNGEPDLGTELDNRKITLEKATELYKASMHSRAEMSKYMIKENDYDIAFVCFTETDRIQHYALNRKNWEDYLAPIYKEASDFIEWILEYSKKQKEDALILVISDHGGQPVRNKFLANTWLIDNGYAALKTGSTKTKGKGPAHPLKRYISERVMKIKIRRAIYNKMPAFMKKAAEEFLNEGLVQEHGKEHIKIQESDLAIGETKVFSAVSYGPVGMMWINDSRFSKPAVKRADTDRIRREIMEKLGKLKTKEGKRLVLEIIDGRKYYKGSKSFIAPDILFELESGYIVDFSFYSSSGIFMKPELARSGDHEPNGIFGYVNNSSANVNMDKKETSVYDIYKYIMEYYSGKEEHH